MKDELEQYAFYRFMKVFYVILLIFCFFMIFFIGLIERPVKIVNLDKSYILCALDGKKISIAANNISIGYDNELSEASIKQANIFCSIYLMPAIDLLNPPPDPLNLYAANAYDLTAPSDLIRLFRLRYVQYNNLSDDKLISLLHEKYYKKIPIKDFNIITGFSLRKMKIVKDKEIIKELDNPFLDLIPNYNLYLKYYYSYSWFLFFLWFICSSILVYLLINIFIGLIIYIVYGCKFNLIKPFLFFPAKKSRVAAF